YNQSRGRGDLGSDFFFLQGSIRKSPVLISYHTKTLNIIIFLKRSIDERFKKITCKKANNQKEYTQWI
ncbi:MAG: hypothetical protein RBT01_16650, partial [Anaerolineaceae bacterium]|nr:hypothetical protein [Anaerolineaceae bacterium]